MSSGVTWSMSPCMIHSNPSRMPSTSTASNRARIVAAPMTLLIPGAGPPPTRIARVFRSVIALPSHEGLGIRRRERSEEHTSELQSRGHLVCRLLLEKKKHRKLKPAVRPFYIVYLDTVVLPQR